MRGDDPCHAGDLGDRTSQRLRELHSAPSVHRVDHGSCFCREQVPHIRNMFFGEDHHEVAIGMACSEII